MKAAVLKGIKELSVENVSDPVNLDDEILIKIDSCGICGSDIRIFQNGSSRIQYPHIIGHEIAGTVVKVGKRYQDKFLIDDKISLSADIPCGSCRWCRAGYSNLCLNNIAFGHEYQGGFAEYIKLNNRILTHGPVVVVPDSDISQEEYTLAEPLACCINGVEKIGNFKNKDILIFGAGPIGCLFAKIASKKQASTVTICDIELERLKAAGVCNIDKAIRFSDENLSDANEEITDSFGFDIIITAAPSLHAQASALKYVKSRGIINFFGGLPECTENLSLNTNDLHYREITLLGSHGSTPRQHKLAVEMIFSRSITVKDLITKSYRLDNIETAFNNAISDKSNIKLVINP